MRCQLMRFYFQLPFLINSEQPDTLVLDESISDLKVLIVDDNEITLDIVTSYMESFHLLWKLIPQPS